MFQNVDLYLKYKEIMIYVYIPMFKKVNNFISQFFFYKERLIDKIIMIFYIFNNILNRI